PAEKDAAVGALHPTLESVGYRVVHVAADSPCDNFSCAQKTAQDLGIDMIFSVALWRRGPGRAHPVLSLVLSDGAGDEISHDVPIQKEGGLPAAVRMAVAVVLSRWPPEKPVPVLFETDPQGAQVLIDDRPSGVTPLRIHLDPGTHRLRLRLDPYPPVAERIEVDRHDRIQRFAYALRKPVAAPGARRGDRSSPASPWNGAVGGATLLLGGVLVALPLVTLAEGGSIDGLGTTTFGTRSAVILSAGVTAVVAGALVLFFEPLGQP
ncbi:MAG: PEGA domain-containing protein, partial [Myxococcales bacterium]|nr:PEGA domain-containing protein [Myxococcales bacterium]